MIVNKITTGFVIQKFDTETGEYLSQEFIAGDQVDYENEVGEPTDQSLMPTPEPYLPFNMVQPQGLIDPDILERKMQVAQDIKKAFVYVLDTGQWHWHDRDEPNELHEAHPTFYDCLYDAVEPYFEGFEE